jgi:hypothetical protein
VMDLDVGPSQMQLVKFEDHTHWSVGGRYMRKHESILSY